jgi:dihydroorotase
MFNYQVHLRQGDLMKHVVPTVRQGGVSVALVMVALNLNAS